MAIQLLPGVPRHRGPHHLYPARLRSEEHTSELQSQSNLVCRLLLEKKKITLVARLINCGGACEYMTIPHPEPPLSPLSADSPSSPWFMPKWVALFSSFIGWHYLSPT